MCLRSSVCRARESSVDNRRRFSAIWPLPALYQGIKGRCADHQELDRSIINSMVSNSRCWRVLAQKGCSQSVPSASMVHSALREPHSRSVLYRVLPSTHCSVTSSMARNWARRTSPEWDGKAPKDASNVSILGTRRSWPPLVIDGTYFASGKR